MEEWSREYRFWLGYAGEGARDAFAFSALKHGFTAISMVLRQILIRIIEPNFRRTLIDSRRNPTIIVAFPISAIFPALAVIIAAALYLRNKWFNKSFGSRRKEKRMRLLNFIRNGNVHLGLDLEKGILDVTALSPDMPACTDEAIRGGDDVFNRLRELAAGHYPLLNKEEIAYAPAVVSPNLILCIGLNYREHVRESSEGERALPEHPVWFNKFKNALVGHGGKVIRCKASAQHDAEAEIVVVIGKRGRYIPKEQARDYIYGYTLGNDISARDLQFRSKQWLIGKAVDTFGPLGPAIVTKDAVDESTLNIRGTINGEIRQDSLVSKMIFDIPTQIADVSQFFELNPGDIIYTGTCEGVIMGRVPPLEKDWLKPGDEVTVESDQLGVLRNIIADE